MHIITAIDQNDGQQKMSDLVAAGSVASRMAMLFGLLLVFRQRLELHCGDADRKIDLRWFAGRRPPARPPEGHRWIMDAIALRRGGRKGIAEEHHARHRPTNAVSPGRANFNFETINNRQCVSEYLKRIQLEGCIATSLVYFG